MAVRELQWTEQARSQLVSLLDFYDQRNGSSTYSEKILARIYKLLGFAQNNPYYGQSLPQVENMNARFVVVEKIQVNFVVDDNTVCVFAVFDARRDPEITERILMSANTTEPVA